MKIKELKVKKVSLKKNGAVSYQVAEEMIEGLYKKNKTKICISTTGIAGPGGSTISKPVGLIYICLLYTSPSPRDQRGSRMPASA